MVSHNYLSIMILSFYFRSFFFFFILAGLKSFKKVHQNYITKIVILLLKTHSFPYLITYFVIDNKTLPEHVELIILKRAILKTFFKNLWLYILFTLSEPNENLYKYTYFFFLVYLIFEQNTNLSNIISNCCKLN